jgi:hypothetical protein
MVTTISFCDSLFCRDIGVMGLGGFWFTEVEFAPSL